MMAYTVMRVWMRLSTSSRNVQHAAASRGLGGCVTIANTSVVFDMRRLLCAVGRHAELVRWLNRRVYRRVCRSLARPPVHSSARL